MKNIAIVSLILLLIAGVGYISKQDKEIVSDENELTPVAMSVSDSSCDLINYVAQENGYFKEEGLDVTFTTLSGNLGMDALAARRTHVASCLSSPVIFAVEAAQPDTIRVIRSLYTSIERPFVWLVAPGDDAGIQSFADLTGKRVAHAPGPMRPLLDAVLVKADVDPATVESVEIAAGQQVAALGARSVDALFATEPTGTTARLSGVGRLAEQAEKYLPSPRYNAANVVLKSYAEANPDIIEALLAAQEKAIDYIETNNEASRLILTKYTQYTEAVAMAAETGTPMRRDEVMEMDALQQYADILFEAGVLNPNVDVRNLFD